MATQADEHLPEKGGAAITDKPTDIVDEESEDVLLDVRAANMQGVTLKLAKDGHTVLVPQPSSDPNDPLNWSWKKKHVMLFLIALTAFLPDFSSAAGVPIIVVQGQEWGMDPNMVNYAGNLNVAMLGVGGLVWIPLCSWIGRLPIMFWTVFLGAICTLICTVTTSFTVFYGFRALQGFFLVSYQVIGLACVKDMFFLHEHARKIGVWVSFFILSPYLSPLFAYFILAGTGGNSPAAGNWRAIFWLVFGIVCVNLALIILFADETFYNRRVPVEAQPSRGSRLSRLIGLWQIRNHNYFPSLWQCTKQLVGTLAKPVVIPALLYYMLVFMWAIGINITSSILFLTPAPAGYGFLPLGVAFLYFTPIVGALVGEFFGHFFNDWVATRYVRKHGGIFHPEGRLPTCYVATVLMIPGLVAVGQALQFHLNYGIIVFGWGMYVCGVMMASVAIAAYLLDSFPRRAPEVSGLLNCFRSFGGFQVGYYQMNWGASLGFDKSFGTQAGLVAFSGLIIIALQIFGGKLRGSK